MTLSEWIDVVSNLGSLGVLAWLVYHAATKLLPDIVERFETALKEQRTDLVGQFKEILEEQRADFRETNENHRIVSIEALKGMSERLGASNEKMADAIAELTYETQRSHKENGARKR